MKKIPKIDIRSTRERLCDLLFRPGSMPSPRFALRGKDSPVAVRDVASVDYTPPDTTSWFSSAVSDTSSYSCSDSGSSGGCD